MSENEEKIYEVRQKLIAMADFLAAMSAMTEHGGVPTHESLAYLSNVVCECSKTLKSIIDAQCERRKTTIGESQTIEIVPF